MTVDEVELERRLRSTLASWVEEAPRSTAQWEPSPAGNGRAGPRFWLARLAPIAVAASIIAAVLVVQDRSEPRSVVVAGQRDLVTAEVRVGEQRGVRALATAHGGLFVASENDRQLYRVDLASHEVVVGPRLAVPDAVGVDDDVVLAIVDAPTRLARLDPRTLSIVQASELSGEPVGMSVVADEVWVWNADGQGRRFDLATLHDEGLLPSTIRPGFQSQGGAGLWRSDPDLGAVLRLDPGTGVILATVPIDGEPRAVAVDDDAVWVSDVANDRVLRLDPDTGRVVSSISVGAYPHGLALGDGRLWVTNFEDGTVSTIDTDRDVVLTTVPIGVRPGTIVLAEGALWVSIHQEGLVRRVDTSELERQSIRPTDEKELNVDIGGRTLFLRCMGNAVG